MRIKEALLASALCVFFTLPSLAQAEQRKVVYNQEYNVYQQVTDNKIVADVDFITLAWDVDSTFYPPYTIVQRYEGKIVKNETTNMASAMVDIMSYSPSTLTISSASGEIMTIDLQYNFPWRMLAYCVAILLVICTATYALLYKKLLSKAHAAAKASLLQDNRKQTRRFDCATVLFADIQGFTRIAEHTDPEQLVDELDRYFICFDELVAQYNVEKIKTIGDAYMCAGGVPVIDSANPIEVALVGLGMIAFVKEQKAMSQGFWNIRVGINTGPLVSALIGNTKKSFDIWGDTVNTASRMESSGVAGEVNVSGNTYSRIADYFECEHRGKMPVKYKGEVDMYFVKRLKPEFAEGDSTFVPNALLKQKIQLLKVHDMEELMLQDLIGMQRENMRRRFEDYVLKIEELSHAEQLRDDEFASCKVIGLTWFAREYFPKEYKTILELNAASLRQKYFTDAQIETITRSVFRLCQGKHPETLIEEILFDARYHYFGRADMIPYLLDWHKEHCESNKRRKRKTRREWLRDQRKDLQQFAFFTDAGRQSAEVSVEEQLKAIDQMIYNA